MEEKKKIFNEFLSIENLSGFEYERALFIVNNLINLSKIFNSVNGLEHAKKLSAELGKRELNYIEEIILNYTIGTIWSYIGKFKRGGTIEDFKWEQEEIEKQIYHYRLASIDEKFEMLPKEIKCSVLTDLASSLDYVGRFVEAIEYYDRVIEIEKDFGMSIGNRGIAYSHFAIEHYDDRKRNILLKVAYSDLNIALKSKLDSNRAIKEFMRYSNFIEKVLPKDYLENDIDLNDFTLGETKEEISYRKWCLENKLFLNTINDIGLYAYGGFDSLTPPPIFVGRDEENYITELFFQIKQEFVSARYLLYEGIHYKKNHFSDKDTWLSYSSIIPNYSLSIEKAKNAYKTTYFLFDKIAQTINFYFKLKKKVDKIFFSGIWYENEEKYGKRDLLDIFKRSRNRPLRGLYWLSKDLYIDIEGFDNSIEPEALKLNKIRNYLVHRYLVVLENDLPQDVLESYNKKLFFFIKREEFEKKTIKVLKLVRSALIYLSLALNMEEEQRSVKRTGKGNIIEKQQNIYNDDWKK